jgi:tetratricopeptide (TPR) repeat protein
VEYFFKLVSSCNSMIVKPPIKTLVLLYFLTVATVGLKSQNADSLSIILNSDRTEVQKFNAHTRCLYRSLDKATYEEAYAYNKAAEQLANKSEKKSWKAKVLHNFGMICYYKAEQAKAIEFYLSEIKIRQELNDKAGLVSANNNLGIIYLEKNDIPAALRIFSVSLGIGKELKNKEILSYSYNNIGETFRIIGDYPRALENYFESLNIEKERKNEEGIAASYNNIALIYSEQGNYESALRSYERSIEIKEGLKNLSDLALGYMNIGTVFVKLGDEQKAGSYFARAFKVLNATQNKVGLATYYINIGDVCVKEGKLKEAKIFFEKAVLINKELDRKGSEGIALSNLAEVLYRLGDIRRAEKHSLASLKIAEEVKDIEGVMTASGILSNIYEDLGNDKSSFFYEKKYAEASEERNSEEDLLSSIRIELNESFEEKIERVNFEREKALVKIKYEAKKQRTFITGLVAGLIAATLLIVFVLISIRKKRKINKKIKEKKKNIDEKQAELLASINYARRIQVAMLPRLNKMEAAINRLKRSSLIILVVLFFATKLSSQKSRIDSLKKIFLLQENDTNRLRTLNDISYQSTLSGDLTTGIEYANDAIRMGETDLSLAESVEDLWKARAIRLQIAAAYHHLGKAYIFQGKVPQAFEGFINALNIYRRTKEVRGEAICLSELGNAYSKLPDNEKAIEYLKASLKLFLSLGNKSDISTTYDNLGFALSMSGKLEEAREIFVREIELDKNDKDKEGEMLSALNLGKVMCQLGRFERSAEYFKNAEIIAKEIGSEQGLAFTYYHVALLYDTLKENERARKFAEMALEKNKLVGNVKDQAMCELQLGALHEKLNDPKKAELNYLSAYATSKAAGELYYQLESCGRLYSYYEKEARWKEAKKYFSLFRKLKEDLSNKNYNTAAKRKQITLSIKKKEEAIVRQNEQKDAVLLNEKKNRKILILFSSWVLFILLIFIFYAIYANIQRQKANILLDEQTKLAEKKREEVLDSIHYAKHIQSSLLTPLKYIDRHLGRSERTIN